MEEPPETDHSATLLAALEAAGPKGLAKTKLLPAKPKQTRAPRGAALETLLGNGRVFKKGTKFVAGSHRGVPINGLTLAYDCVEALATPEVATLFATADFTAALKAISGKKQLTAAKKEMNQAVTTLLEEGKLLAVKFAKAAKKPKVYYLHAASLPAGIAGAAASSAITPLEPSNSGGATGELHSSEGLESLGAQIRDAYRALKEAQGFTDIAISDLQARSEVALPTLLQYLREESAAGRACPTAGDWSKAPEKERDAALYLDGQAHLRVQLI